MNDEALVSLVGLIVGGIVSALVLYVVVRAAVVSALRAHSLWRADGRYEVDLQRHKRDAARRAAR